MCYNMESVDFNPVDDPVVEHGGALVELMPLDRRVVGSNPALAAT